MRVLNQLSMRIITALLFVFVIATIVLSILLYKKSEADFVKDNSKTNLPNITLTNKAFNEILRADTTESVPSNIDTLKSYTDYFESSLDRPDASGKRIFPYSVWVKKSIISSAFNDSNVDGFRIIPIRYPSDWHSPSTRTPYKKNDVNFLIMFTREKAGGGHENDINLMFDYNQPCPNPRNCP